MMHVGSQGQVFAATDDLASHTLVPHAWHSGSTVDPGIKDTLTEVPGCWGDRQVAGKQRVRVCP